jgi:amino acid transporter
MAFLILATAVNASIMASVAVAAPLSTLGIATGNSELQSLASTLSTPTWSFIIGLITILFVSLVAVAGNRVIALINKITFIIGTLGLITIVVVLASITQPQFQAAFDGFAGSGAYQNMISSASTAGYSIPSDWFTPTLLSLPLTFFLLLGYEFNTYYSGEIRRVSRSMTISVLFALIFGVAFFATIAVLMQRAFGLDFIASASYLYTAGSSSYTLAFAPWVNNFLVLVDSNWLINAIIIASFVSWGYLLLINWFVVISRHFLAWSFDRAVPSALGKVNERFHSPLVAIVLTFSLSTVALAFYVFLSSLAALVNISFLLLTAVFLDGLAGAVLPWVKKSLFDSSPEIVKKKIGGIPLISILGIYSVVLIGLLLADSLYNPEIAGPLGASTIAIIFGSFILGAAVYLAMKAYNARQGLDLSLVYKEIPPE